MPKPDPLLDPIREGVQAVGTSEPLLAFGQLLGRAGAWVQENANLDEIERRIRELASLGGGARISGMQPSAPSAPSARPQTGSKPAPNQPQTGLDAAGGIVQAGKDEVVLQLGGTRGTGAPSTTLGGAGYEMLEPAMAPTVASNPQEPVDPVEQRIRGLMSLTGRPIPSHATGAPPAFGFGAKRELPATPVITSRVDTSLGDLMNTIVNRGNAYLHGYPDPGRTFTEHTHELDPNATLERQSRQLDLQHTFNAASDQDIVAGLMPVKAAMAVLKMSPFQKIRMYAAGQMAIGRNADEVTKEILEYYGPKYGIKPERIKSQIAAAIQDLDEIKQVTGGKALDVDRYIAYYRLGSHNREWYEEMVPFVREHFPSRARRKFNPAAAGGEGLTWEQDRFIQVYAAFGSQAGPRDNYRKAMKVVDFIKRAAKEGTTDAARDRALAKYYPWGMTAGVSAKTGKEAAEPGLQSLRALLERGESLGDRKIESYFHNLAQQARPGYLDRPVMPLTGDRWHIRFAGFPTEQVDEAGNIIYQKGRSTAVQSKWLGTSPIANSGYQVSEDVAREATSRLGLPPSDVRKVQAAIWDAYKKEVEFFERGRVGQQGYPIQQQHTLAQTLAAETPADVAAREAAAKASVPITVARGGGTVHPTLGDLLGQPHTSVSIFPERGVHVPPAIFSDPKKGTAAVESFARDNADLLKQGDLSIGLWRIEDPAVVRARGEKPYTLNDREVPGGTVVLDIVATPTNAAQNRQGKLLGMTYGQYAVYDLGVMPAGREVPTFAAGHPLAPLPPLYGRLADVPVSAQRRLLGALEARGSIGDPAYDQLLSDIMAEMRPRRTGKLAEAAGGGSRPAASASVSPRELTGKTWHHGGSGGTRDPLFLTSDRRGAEWFGQNRGAGTGDVRSFTVDVKAPFSVESYDDAKRLRDLLVEAGIDVRLTNGPDGWTWHAPAVAKHSPYNGDNIFDVMYLPEAREALRKAGYDALHGSDVLSNGEIEVLIPVARSAAQKARQR